MPRTTHRESHKLHNAGWLRAAVLGANDGLISTAGLVVGMAAAGTELKTLLLTAAAGLTAGAFSMAAGEYVSVSSQADVEQADRATEARELAERPEWELNELKQIYVQRGLSPELADQVARQLTEKDALGAHLRDELGITAHSAARPLQAALASAASFVVGALLPILVVLLYHGPGLTTLLVGATLVLLAVLGAVAAKLGGAPMGKGAARVLFWGALAMGASALIGKLFGTGMVG
ncbi:VIT family protein [Ottowia beijingensis]|uniref:VIT family protein n=1 Tax=Ottowia beijingensis TaxID=1207057 RepID=A0A853IV15_9BURK|nr:VIT family protein [Ottowia beijingensis]NZA01771.1 VIT family protein [Ottowia beijingensis]